MRRAAARKAMRDHAISQRRACRLVGVDSKTVRRDHPRYNPEFSEEMKEISSNWRRFGYRWIDVLLERKGMIMNHKSCTASKPRKSWACVEEGTANERVDHER